MAIIGRCINCLIREFNTALYDPYMGHYTLKTKQRFPGKKENYTFLS